MYAYFDQSIEEASDALGPDGAAWRLRRVSRRKTADSKSAILDDHLELMKSRSVS